MQVWCSVAQATFVGSDRRVAYGGLQGDPNMLGGFVCSIELELCGALEHNPHTVRGSPHCQPGPLAVPLGAFLDTCLFPQLECLFLGVFYHYQPLQLQVL